MPSTVSVFTAAALFLSVAIYFLTNYSYLPPQTNCLGEPNAVRVFTSEALSNYRTSSWTQPMLLVIMGEVFDVSSGSRFYGEGEGYHTFIGRDNSRAFASGKFDEVSDEVLDLFLEEVKMVTGWLDFYHKHKTYTKVGVAQGKYFDCNGVPTAYRQQVLDKAATDLQPSLDETILKRQQFCHISSNVTHSTLTCKEGRFPRLLRYKNGQAGGCICPDAYGLRDLETSTMTVEQYPSCEGQEPVCVIAFSKMPS